MGLVLTDSDGDDDWDLGESHHLTQGRADSPRTGSQVGDYDLIEQLGSGAMGTVFVGRHRDLNLRHAVKIVERLEEGTDRRKRFEREGAALSRLSHPNVIKVHQFGYLEETIGYFSMDLVEGQDLESYADEDWPATSETLRLISRIARALEHMHAAGIVHRDLKPANVLIRGEDRQPILVDLGLARDPTDARMTKTNQIVGTPTYMPPEQITGMQQLVGPPSDVFALGVMLYQLLTHELPFTGRDLPSLASSIINSTPVAPSEHRPDLDPVLDRIVARLLAKEPQNRPEAGWVADVLERLGRGESVEVAGLPPDRRLIAGVAISVVSLGVLAWVLFAPGQLPGPPTPAPVATEPTPPVEDQAPPDPRLAELEEPARAIAELIQERFGSDDCLAIAEAGEAFAQDARVVLTDAEGAGVAEARENAIETLVDAALACHRKRFEDHREPVEGLLRLASRLAPDDPRPELARRILTWNSTYFRKREVPPFGPVPDLPESLASSARWSTAHHVLALHERLASKLNDAALLEAALTYPDLDLGALSYSEAFIHEQILQVLRTQSANRWRRVYGSGKTTRSDYERVLRSNRQVLAIRRITALGNTTRYADEVIDVAALLAFDGDTAGARVALEELGQLRPQDREGRAVVLAYCELLEGRPGVARRKFRELPPYESEQRGLVIDRRGLVALAYAAQGEPQRARQVLGQTRMIKPAFSRFAWLSIPAVRAALEGRDPRERLTGKN